MAKLLRSDYWWNAMTKCGCVRNREAQNPELVAISKHTTYLFFLLLFLFLLVVLLLPLLVSLPLLFEYVAFCYCLNSRSSFVIIFGKSSQSKFGGIRTTKINRNLRGVAIISFDRGLLRQRHSTPEEKRKQEINEERKDSNI